MIEPGKINSRKIIEYLAQGKRFDGRKPEEFRKVTIETGVSGNAEGSARVRIGATEVIVGVKMDVGTPYPDNPTKGNLLTGAELSPLSSPKFESGPPKIQAIELGRVIDRGVRESKYIDFDKLCIKEGEKVWNIYIDIYTVNDDGNLFDAAGLGAFAALRNARIPKYDLEEEKLYHELTDEPLPLAHDVAPVSVTVYKIGDKLLVDPTREEEDSCEMRLTTGGREDRFFSMQKGLIGTLSIEEMEKALDLAEQTRKKLATELKGQI
jgi:exosome complex component RRP42